MKKATRTKTPARSHAAMDLADERALTSIDEQQEILELPVMPLRGAALLPLSLLPMLVDRDILLQAIDEAESKKCGLFVVAQRSDEDEPGPDDIYTIGVEGAVEHVLRLPDGSYRLLLRGVRRLRFLECCQRTPYLRARVEVVPEQDGEATPDQQMLLRATLAIFEKCVRLSPLLSDEAYIAAMNIKRPGAAADFMLSLFETPLAARQRFLETIDVMQRLDCASTLLSNELHVLELEHEIHSHVRQEMEKTQREFFLRAQLKAIQHELGESDPHVRENEDLRIKIFSSRMPDEVRARALQELEHLSMLSPLAPDSSIIRSYLDWLVSLPWTATTIDRLDIKAAAEILEERHYGLGRVKERILEYIAVRQLSNTMRSPILCFVGPPGVGKTSLGRSIAQALNRKFVRLALGGVQDEAEIRGHRRTYIGALPGRLIQTMRSAGTINPLFMLDEIDKIGTDFHGDPASALLEVLDPEQNYAFSDHYLEVPYDFSQALFITTANVLHPIPPALRDRLEIIELPGYTEEEKLQIARRFLIPRQMQEHGLKPSRIEIGDEAVRRVIREYTYEAGVRNLERELATAMRKVARRVAEGKRLKTLITPAKVPEYLGPQKFYYGQAEEKDEVGVATGVAWTNAGGDLTTVEAILLEGRGNLTLTGQLGDVMKESALAALSYARARAGQLGIESRFYEKYDVHLHLPSGAIPKDGPSAGITMATALLSALTRRAARRDVAMTGEITLRGRILPVGGVKEKILAAHRAGIVTFILPKRNLKDLDDVPGEIIREMHIIPVEHMDEVTCVALHTAVQETRGVAVEITRPALRRETKKRISRTPSAAAAPEL